MSTTDQSENPAAPCVGSGALLGDFMPREGVNGFSLLQEPTGLVDSALQVYARCFAYPDSRALHEAAHAYRRELIRIVAEYRKLSALNVADEPRR